MASMPPIGQRASLAPVPAPMQGKLTQALLWAFIFGTAIVLMFIGACDVVSWAVRGLL